MKLQKILKTKANKYNFEAITYKRKVIAYGYVFDERRFRWTLKKRYQPHYYFRPRGTWSEYVGSQSPQKQNFKLYISMTDFKVGWLVEAYKTEGIMKYNLMYVCDVDNTGVLITDIAICSTLKDVYAIMRELKTKAKQIKVRS